MRDTTPPPLNAAFRMMIGYPPRSRRPRRPWWRRPGPILVAIFMALALSACYGASSLTGATRSPELAPSARQQTATIALMAPVTGGVASVGAQQPGAG